MRPKMTVSLALPGSVVDHAQSPPLRTYLAGQIARAAVIFRIDEVIVYDDKLSKNGFAIFYYIISISLLAPVDNRIWKLI